jgi:hypothetical protein
VGDVTGGLERTNEEVASEAGVERGEEFPASETLHRGLGLDGNLSVEGGRPSRSQARRD